jgi:nucleoside-diphosphate-sugar epimerase
VPTVLVAGATGVIGSHVASEFETTPGWRVTTTSRRMPCPAPTDHLPADLLDAAAVDALVAARSDVTHLVFAAGGRHETATMLASLLSGFRQSQASLRHVTLFDDARAYGADLGPYKVPAKESDPRLPTSGSAPDLVDLVSESADADGFHWTVLRTDTVIGNGTAGSPNLLLAIAAYASVCRAVGLPLRFPGTEEQYRSLAQVTDAELLGRAAVWAASSEAAMDDVFNVTNGDAFRWCDVWTEIADVFGMAVAPPMPFALPAAMAGHSDVWDWLTEQYGLAPVPWDAVADWDAAATALAPGFDRLYSTIKVRQAGFGDSFDSAARFRTWFERLADARVIPPVGDHDPRR